MSSQSWFIAASKGDIPTLNKAIIDGADVFAQDLIGWSALMHAAYGGHADAMRLLLDTGADVFAVNQDGETSLMIAAEQGDALCVELLCDYGADVNATDNDGYTALMCAVCNSLHAQRIVDLLLERGADPSLCAKDGRSVRDIAQPRGRESLLPD